jgi:surface antigen
LSRRAIRYSLIGVNLLILGGVLWFFLTYNQGGTTSSFVGLSSVSNTLQTTSDPLDQLSAANIAVEVADMANIPEATAVQNQAETVNAELAITPAENLVAAKPQIVATALKTRQDIQVYTVQSGDTLASVATKFNITSNSIMWSNSLTSTTLKVGSKLVIPPISGIVYTVKQGDTAQSLGQKYDANADQITAFNDAEISGLTAGEEIVIPNGQQPVVTSASYGIYGGLVNYGSNAYDFGNCTYWAAYRRDQVGSPLPSNLGNAISWPSIARADGLSVGNVPEQYAVARVVLDINGRLVAYDHVVFVESVNTDGSINISEMNVYGYDVVDRTTVSAAVAANYDYIY